MRKKTICNILLCLLITNIGLAQQKNEKESIWRNIETFFSPPKQYEEKYGEFRSLFQFYNGGKVETKEDWRKRREEILQKWHGMMGEWPDLLKDQEFELIDSIQKYGYIEYRVSFNWLPEERTEGYFLVPDLAGKLPAVITVFYEPETAVGKGKEYRDFAYQLVKRGFITLSIGTKETTEDKVYSLYYPSIDNASIQPLSTLAYAAANAWYALSNFEGVDGDRIGIMGHSYGGKWAMFASCLFDKFACGVWSDPGIVFDETKGSGVNYWEPWYLGYYPPHPGKIHGGKPG